MKLIESYLKILKEQVGVGKPTIADIVETIKDLSQAVIYYEGSGEEIDERTKIAPGYRLIYPMVIGSGFQSKGTVFNTDKIYLRAYVLKDISKAEAVQSLNKRKEFSKNLPSRSVSKTNRDPYWRLFRVDKISEFYPIFGSPETKKIPLYNPNDKNLVDIIASAQV